jgi:uncharacterized heparinase superfamily protein
MEPARRRASLQGPTRCCFLDEEHDIGLPTAWNDPVREKLWLYNLHYFDDLNALDADQRTGWQRTLIGRWVHENPPTKGVGWEAYPASLRIVNWIKWGLAGNVLDSTWLDSLAVQARWLAGRLELHLLGNHLFTNAKALVFAGLFFDGTEASAWLEKGMAILREEIPEQILSDGGHFERSTLYHALVLEDLLDLFNLAEAYHASIPPGFRDVNALYTDTIRRMRVWLAALCHPDGELSFFNDAAIGIAPAVNELESYAIRLGLGPSSAPQEACAHFGDSGYIRVDLGDKGVALLDVAPIGPDYLPGHAHADTLSFEMSVFGQRVVVNSGISRYGLSPERLRQRGTAAHNTVTIDGLDSSEVWGGFRVARRAKPFGLRIWGDGRALRILCAHDGYRRLKGKPVHWREWRFEKGLVEVVDNLEGGFREAVSRLHFHPDIALSHQPESGMGHAVLPTGQQLHWQVEGADSWLAESAYFPEFGIAIANQCLEMRLTSSRCAVRLHWV